MTHLRCRRWIPAVTVLAVLFAAAIIPIPFQAASPMALRLFASGTIPPRLDRPVHKRSSDSHSSYWRK